MTQAALQFDARDPELKRVSGRIEKAIVYFCRVRLYQREPEFHGEDLRHFIVGKVAPGSTDRILRDLRQRGVVDYEVVNRRQSLYRVLEVRA